MTNTLVEQKTNEYAKKTHMTGYAFIKPGVIEYITKPVPVCGDDDAIVKPTVIAACSSDVHSVNMGISPPNTIMGHEGIGIVVETGKNVTDFIPGDLVVIPAVTPDWRTREVQYGLHQHSGGMLKGISLSGYADGLYAEYTLIRQADMNLALVPEGMDEKSACLIGDMVTTGLHGAELADIAFGDTVVVIGIGPVGLMAVAGAKLRGAGAIYAVGSRPKCIDVAYAFGATEIVNYKNGNIIDRVMALTNGKGADGVIIAGGGPEVLNQAVMMTRPGGHISNINMFETFGDLPISSPGWGFGMAHKTIKGGLCPGGRVRMEALANLVMAGRIDPSQLVTHEFRGMEGIEKAYRLMAEKPADLIKPIVWLD